MHAATLYKQLRNFLIPKYSAVNCERIGNDTNLSMNW